MASFADLARRSPLTTFFVLAFALTWALLPLAQVSIAFSLAALFGPAAAAVITAAPGDANHRRDLRDRVTRWRVPLRWYVVALLLPLPISALASGIRYVWGARGPIDIMPITALGLVVFVMVVGEEIGWRGFALPRLLARSGPWRASLVLGSLWALWHLPLFSLAGMPQFGRPLVPYVGYTIALSIILTFLAQRTEGSVLIATLFHGAVNTFVVANTTAGSTLKGWGDAVAYGLVALVTGAAAWRTEAARSESRPNSA